MNDLLLLFNYFEALMGHVIRRFVAHAIQWSGKPFYDSIARPVQWCLQMSTTVKCSPKRAIQIAPWGVKLTKDFNYTCCFTVMNLLSPGSIQWVPKVSCGLLMR